MSWEVVPLLRSLGRYREAWDSLNATLYRSNPFFDSCFVEPMLKYFAMDHERLCLHTREGAIDGMLIVTPQGRGKWSLFVPAQAQIASLFIKAPQNLETLIRQLPGLALALECPCQDPLYTPFSLPLDDMNLVAIDHATTISVQLEGTFEDYWDARSRNLQKNIKRYSRRVHDAGMTIRPVYLDDAADITEAINRYGEMESRGWKGLKGTAIHSDNIQGCFYREALCCFAASGRAAVYELYFDDILVASRLCIACQEMLVILKTAYNENYKQYAPGRLLLHALLQREFELQRVATVEFYTNATADQIGWSTHQRRISHIMVFKNKTVKKAFEWAHRVRALIGPLTHMARNGVKLCFTAFVEGASICSWLF